MFFWNARQPKLNRAKPKARKAKTGYGVAFLGIFLASSVMIGASLQLVAAPVAIAYLGAASQNNMAANQMAQSGMAVVQADLQSKFQSNQTIDTSYTFSSSSNSDAIASAVMPQDPGATAGATTSVGTYTANVLLVQGNYALVKVTALVGNGQAVLTRLVAMSQNQYSVGMLDNLPTAVGAYGLRKLRTAHAGSAIRVRRSTDNAEQDIGFTASGDLDVSALRTFIDGATPQRPLDVVTGASSAFGLRKLRAAYAGSAIRVRRSSDSTEQDIGFDMQGDLDVNALMNFVGTGSGYIRTWYDQTTNGYNLDQSNTTYQPRIVASGVLYTLNGRPVVRFDGSDDHIFKTQSGSNSFSVLAVARPAATMEIDPKATSGTRGDSGEKYLFWPKGGSSGTDAGAGLSLGTNGVGAYEHTGVYLPALATAEGTVSNTQPSLVTMIYNNKTPYLYMNSNLVDMGLTSPMTTVNAPSYVGGWPSGYGFHNGDVGELYFYDSTLSTANRAKLEQSEARYFSATLGTFGYSLPVSQVDGSANNGAAFGLRRLKATYTGSAIRVRRSNDNQEQDIALNADGSLNTSALTSFVGANNGFVTIWYDQSGNGANAVQANASQQPRIVNAGTVHTVNGRYALFFDGTDDQLRFSRSILTRNFTISACFSPIVDGWGTFGNWWENMGLVDYELPGWQDDFGLALGPGRRVAAGMGKSADATQVTISGAALSGVNDGRMHRATYSRSDGTLNLYVDGNGVVSSSAASTADLTAGSTITIGSTQTNFNYYNGYMGEVLVYNAALGSSDIATLNDNQSKYFGVNGAATAHTAAPMSRIVAAYSLRKLTPWAYNAIQVRRSSDNAKLTFGFDSSGNLNTAAILAFVGSGNGYVSTWFDQISQQDNEDWFYNAKQSNSTYQPMIVNAGTLVTQDGRPTLQFNTSGLLLGTSITSLRDYSAFGAFKNASSGANLMLMAAYGVNRQVLRNYTNKVWNYDGISDQAAAPTGIVTHTATSIMDMVRSGSTNTGYYNGGTGVVTTTHGGAGPSAGLMTMDEIGGLGAVYYSGNISELLLYTTALSDADRVRVETNLLSYYDTTGAKNRDGYIVTWYDQSGNGRDLTQAEKSLQPRIRLSRGVNRVQSIQFESGQFLENGSYTAAITGGNVTASIITATSADGLGVWDARIATLMKNTDVEDWNASSSSVVFSNNNWNSISTCTNSVYPYISTAPGVLNQYTAWHTATGAYNLYRNGFTEAGSQGTATFNLAPDRLRLGNNITTSTWWGRPFHGQIAEFVLFDSALTTTQQKWMESSQIPFATERAGT